LHWNVQKGLRLFRGSGLGDHSFSTLLQSNGRLTVGFGLIRSGFLSSARLPFGSTSTKAH
jgi:hypothetical protein